MFHKEAEHGGATGSTLQPQQDWSILLGWLLVREYKVKISAPPCGGFVSQEKCKLFLLTLHFTEMYSHSTSCMFPVMLRVVNFLCILLKHYVLFFCS